MSNPSSGYVDPDDAAPPPPSHRRLKVRLPSGAMFDVLTPQEAEYLEERVGWYQDQNKFDHISDQQDVDRLLWMELFCFRWALWINTGEDYDNEDINPTALRKSLSEYSSEIRQVKKALGIDKVGRDKAKGEDSVPEFIMKLLQRAKDFGYHRDSQSAKAIELIQEAIALYTWHINCDEDERREAHITQADLIQWIGSVLKPEFEQLDIDFRKQQKMWIRDQ